MSSNLIQNLSGQWAFALDPDDVGLEQKWFKQDAPFDKQKVKVPGAWQAQGLGDNKHRPVPPQSKMSPVQMEKTSYRGTGWYRRSLTVPADWQGKQIWLVMGGTHPVTELWLDDCFITRHVGSQLQYRLNITKWVKFGTAQMLTVRISEFPGEPVFRNYRNPLGGTFLDWCNTWSGIYRDVWLEAKDAVRIGSVSVFPDIKRKAARVRVALEQLKRTLQDDLSLRITLTGPDGIAAGSVAETVRMNTTCHAVEIVVPVKQMRLWSPDTPELYQINVTLEKQGGGVYDECTDRFGMREFAVEGNKILLNGKPLWLRGFGDHVMFPLTLYPGIERPQIEKELRRAKEYGFNFVLHYTMPFKEYLDIADEVGVLVQFSPILTSARLLMSPQRDYRKIYMQPAYLERCIRQNINHPSVMVYTFTGEVYFHNTRSQFVRDLAILTRATRKIDPTRLINSCAGVDRASAARDDTDILEVAGGHTAGCPGELDVFPKPVILHEYRWWSSYPNPKLKGKYKKAAMRPWFIELAEQVAREKGFYDQLPLFVANSEKLQTTVRKIGLEQGRRAQGICGYELYLGKDTGWATEGLWDDFGDPKNVSAEEFLQTNAETVLLIDKDFYYRNYWSGEKITAELWLSHFGHQPVKNGKITWQLISARGKKLAAGECRLPKFASYQTEMVCRLNILPERVVASTKATLHVTLKSDAATVHNNWDFWLFARDLLARPSGRIASIGMFGRGVYDLDFFEDKKPSDDLHGYDAVVTNVLNKQLIDYMEQGGKALLIAQGVFPELFCEFKPNNYNGSPTGNSGTVIYKHPALGSFPHDGWCGLQFYGLMEDAPVLNLDAWPVSIDPIIRSINNFQKGIRRAYLCEAKVGSGALLTTTFNFKTLRGIGRYYCEVENTYLFDQLVRYIMTPRFKPTQAVPLAFLKNLVGLKNTKRPEEGEQNPAYIVNSGIS